MGKLRIGTSGYNYKDWKGKFYPQDLSQKKWLSYYSRYFNTVEINSTFYRSFSFEVFKKWKSDTPSDFCFAIKVSRYITHIKRIKGVENEVKSFFENAQGLETKLGVVLWQFPLNFKLKAENLKLIEDFVLYLPKNIRQAFEFRDSSWFSDEIFEFLNKYKMGFVINDSSKFPNIEKITGGFAYIRFHGPAALYSSSYTDQELEIWAERIREYLKKYDVYCYFNNDVSGFAIDDAETLKKLLK